MSTIDVPVTTIEELWAIPEDGARHELLRGEHVVTPSPIRLHQRISAQLSTLLENFLAKHPTLTMYYAPSDVRMDTGTLVQPDIFVVREEDAGGVNAGQDIEVPELIVEILSPGTASRDRGKKREIYQEARVKEYWIVDIDAGLIERWRPVDERPEIMRDEIEWCPDRDEKSLTISLMKLFPKQGSG